MGLRAVLLGCWALTVVSQSPEADTTRLTADWSPYSIGPAESFEAGRSAKAIREIPLRRCVSRGPVS